VGTNQTSQEKKLIKALQGAHEESEKAFTEIYQYYAHQVYSFILRMTGNVAVSQDLLQETFMKFYAATRQDLIVANVRGFLFMIARNVSLNWRRDEHPTVSIEDMLLELESHHHVIEQDELLHLINHSLDLLELEYREAFILKYYQGYSYDEMSQLTGDTIPTLRNRVWRAKEKIQNSLRPYILELQS
jgi:RNA polymerase sigma-70 factor (ECF subfamily)